MLKRIFSKKGKTFSLPKKNRHSSKNCFVKNVKILKKCKFGIFFISIYELCNYVLLKKKGGFFFVVLFFEQQSTFKKMVFFFGCCASFNKRRRKVRNGVRPPSPQGENKKNFGVEATPYSKKDQRVCIYFFFSFYFIKCLIFEAKQDESFFLILKNLGKKLGEKGSVEKKLMGENWKFFWKNEKRELENKNEK
ncbi:hypothetical protein RFI_33932 [Reticulomyxa filosa]|uniref:Uncharacterized protein n=1 Tax=Reticulomyxa filosa TaxID=46433 RepID=X6LQ28_RETFI|nr:hypothetical protein RFI_33932 [Reticulomyxa filosa]|eukprot:ETO03476.1 hypothetical protein RFI_33932 [Reticulomyxa filosa]